MNRLGFICARCVSGPSQETFQDGKFSIRECVKKHSLFTDMSVKGGGSTPV